MVTRNRSASQLGVRPHSRPRVSTAAPRSGRERGFFALSLFVFGLCSAWSATILLARIYPALFPGRDLGKDIAVVGVISDGLNALPLPPAVQLPSSEESAFNRRINVLVMGVDKRPGDQDVDQYRTDTIMIGTVDPVTKQASVLSIPRDVVITITDPASGFKYEDRINSSYGVGIRNGKTIEAGAKQLQADIKANFGIETNYWVLMDFKGVEQLINVLGGIDIEIPPDLAVPDWWYSDDDVNARYVAYPPGKQHLDGYNAVAFGRYRNSGQGDLDRVRRQQLVLQTALNKVFGQALLDNPLALFDAYSQIIKTDLPRQLIPGMGLLAKETGGDLATYSLGSPWDGVETVTYETTAQGASVLRLNQANVQKILAAMFTKATYAKSLVEIQDAVGGEEGDRKATQLGEYLHFNKALPSVYIGEDLPPQAETTITVYSENWRNMAVDIAGWLGVPASSIKTAQKPAGSSLPDVIITVGRNFTVPAN